MNSREFIKLLDDHEINIFDAGLIFNKTGLKYSEWQHSLRSLLRNGLILLLEKGKYVRHNFSDEKVIGSFIAGQGAISYWSALHHHGFTTQVPNVVFVQSTRRKTDKTILGVSYKFIRLSEVQYTGVVQEGYGNNSYYITDIEKTIIDCLHKPAYAGEFPELVKAIYNIDFDQEKLIKYCKLTGSGAVTKKLAFYLDLFKKNGTDAFLQYATAYKSKGYVMLHPLGQKSGNYINKWDLCLNIPIEDILHMAKSDI